MFCALVRVRMQFLPPCSMFSGGVVLHESNVKSCRPSLAPSCENMASHGERIMEKTRKFQIDYVGLTNLCQHSTTDLVRGIITTNVNNLRCGRHHLSTILKLQAAFLYSIYHQRAGKTSLLHMRGVDFTHFNTCCTFKLNGS